MGEWGHLSNRKWGATEPSGMKCEELGHQVNGSNGNWETKRQEMGVLNLLWIGEKGARSPKRPEEGGSALRYRSGDLHSRGGCHLSTTEDMRSEPREQSWALRTLVMLKWAALTTP